MHNLDSLTTRDIALLLGNPDPATCSPPSAPHLSVAEFRQAGVLVPFVRHDSRWHLLFIRRAEARHDHHSGQVAFAGGKQEKSDTDIRHTALREAHEELGIRPEHVSLLGQLGSQISYSGFLITPVVGYLDWPYQLTPEVREVSRAFTIPLNWLADPGNHEMRPRQLPNLNQTIQVAYFQEYDGELLWGATARMVLQLVTILRGHAPLSRQIRTSPEIKNQAKPRTPAPVSVPGYPTNGRGNPDPA
ncbi:MAG: CoA pyrophosphatase [Thiothrix sp.]|nr:CoA pyrophosphatase [Thiothrix sp.]HPE59175.1 CoA pyrophosphatase [Thiolinea sp.]